MTVLDRFSLTNKIAIITGGGGLLGARHGEAISEAGGHAVLWDINLKQAEEKAAAIASSTGQETLAQRVDITDPDAIRTAFDAVLARFKRCDILINNAANDPKVGEDQDSSWSRLENFSLGLWDKDIAVGLTGAFLCAQTVGAYMADQGGGVILNISSDLGVIAPDQRLYQRPGLPDNQQPVKPVTYSVVKHGLIGLTKYLSTYWARQSVRVNAISPGGVYTGQPEDFLSRLTNLIPMGRMATEDEYMAAVVFLCSDASSYMTGQNLIMDGGRTVL